MSIISVNNQKLEDIVDTIIGFHHILGNVHLHEETIGEIYNLVVRDINNAFKSASKRYHPDSPQSKLSVEAQTFQKKKMFKNHGITLRRLYNLAEPYMDNLYTLLLPLNTTNKLIDLMEHYEQLTNKMPGYNPIIN